MPSSLKVSTRSTFGKIGTNAVHELVATICFHLREGRRIYLLQRSQVAGSRIQVLDGRTVSVRPSVCLSVTLVHSIHMAKVIIKFLCRPGRPIILVFDPPAPVHNSKGNPFSGGTKYKGVGEKILRFSTEIDVYLGNDTRQSHSCYETL